MNSHEPAVRPPGYLERWQMAREAIGFYNNVCNQCTYSIPAYLFPPDHDSARGSGSGTSTPAQPSLAQVTELVHRAIRLALTEHEHGATLAPLGVTAVDGKSKKARFKFLQSVDLRDVVEVAGGMSTEKLLQYGHSLHLTGANGTLPMWRVCVNLCRPRKGPTTNDIELDVAFFFSHAIGDGFSGLAFHDAFIEALRTRLSNFKALAEQGQTPIEKPVDPIVPLDVFPQALRQSLEEAIPMTLTWGGIWRAIKAMFINTTKGIWTGPTIKAPASKNPDGSYNLSTSVNMLAVPAVAVEQMRKLCKENKTTITAYLTFLLADSLANLKNDLERNHQSGHKEIEKICADVDISLRRKRDLMPKAGQPNFMVSYTTNYTHPFYISPQGNRIVSPEVYEKLKKMGGMSEDAGKSKVSVKDWARERGQEIDWKEVRRVKRGLIQSSNTTKDHLVTFLKLISNPAKFNLGKLGKERSHSFEVSNLGVLDLVTFREAEERRRYKKMKRRFPENEVQVVNVVFSQSASVTGCPFCFSIATLRDGDCNVVLTFQEGLNLEGLGERVLQELARRLNIRR